MVIAIIAILAALLMPSLKRALEAGRTALCQSNLHQIGIGVVSYTQDNDGWMPVASGDGHYVVARAWRQDLSTYGEYLPGGPHDGAIYHCPSTSQYTMDLIRSGNAEYARCKTAGYGWNWEYAGWHDNPPGGAPSKKRRNAMKVEYPIALIIVGDTTDTGVLPYHPLILTRAGGGGSPPAERHNGGGNYLYLDTHVELHSVEFMWDQKNWPLFWGRDTSFRWNW